MCPGNPKCRDWHALHYADGVVSPVFNPNHPMFVWPIKFVISHGDFLLVGGGAPRPDGQEIPEVKKGDGNARAPAASGVASWTFRHAHFQPGSTARPTLQQNLVHMVGKATCRQTVAATAAPQRTARERCGRRSLLRAHPVAASVPTGCSVRAATLQRARQHLAGVFPCKRSELCAAVPFRAQSTRSPRGRS